MSGTKQLTLAAAIAVLLALPARAEWRDVLGPTETNHLASVLDILNMSTNDLGFDKDVGRPTNTLGYVREMLHAPMRLPAMADELMRAIEANSVEELSRTCCRFLEVTNSPPPTFSPTPAVASTLAADARLGRELAMAIDRFVSAAVPIAAGVSNAFAQLTADEQNYLAASQLLPLLGGNGVGGDDAAAQFGIPAATIRAGRAHDDDIDPEPEALRIIDLIGKVDFALLFGSGAAFHQACRELAGAAARTKQWPAAVVRVTSPLGEILVGTGGRDVFDRRAFLILDPGGDDLYVDTGAVANGLRGARVAAALDLGGDDHYQGRKAPGPGSALYGVALLFDAAGNDRYDAGGIGQSAAVLGITGLEDVAGNDTYTALKHSQAAGTCGIAILRDRAGIDTYDVGMRGQAYAGVRGLGLLIDDGGNDRYVAGGRDGDHERHAEHFLSLSQGFATGARPFAGGGVAALVDRGGNDTYTADVYGQGVSYWYSVGMLIDESGHDRYSLHEYGQGSGIHLSHGLLVEGGGNDVYYGWSLAQGNAHDYAVGMLFDRGGDDTYTADHYAQGRGINNALGLLLDSDGRDAYLGRRPASCQGIGHNSSKRDYGSVSLLLDLKGRDIYTCTATNGAALIREDVGIVYDFGDKQ